MAEIFGGRGEISKGMYTTSEIATFLGVHPNTVRNWADQGLLHAIRLGPRRDRRFTQEEVDRFTKGNADDEGRVASIIREGYKLYDKVIRPAQVSVFKGSQKAMKPFAGQAESNL
jgi:excisionase family DNA binding protein